MNNPDFYTSHIEKSISNYARMGIQIEYLGFEKEYHYIKIVQKNNYNGFILSQKELIERAKDIFRGIDNLRYSPLTFTLDVKIITPEWIESKMKEFNISRNDILSHLHIDKSTLSLYLSGSRNMSRLAKASFYWYFSTFEINSNLRSDY